MSQTHTVGKSHTTVTRTADLLKVTYHSTVVVEASDTHIILRTGGWFTATTKGRMNQASNQYGLGFQVYQKRGAWYVSHRGETQEFNGNSITLERSK